MKICRPLALSALSVLIAIQPATSYAQTKITQSSGPKAPAAPTAPSMPNMPGVSMPALPSMPPMPSISTPAQGSSFYTPGAHFTESKKDSASSTGADTIGQAAGEEKTETPSSVQEASKNKAGVTAADLKALANNGLLTDISSLLGGSSSSKDILARLSSVSNPADLTGNQQTLLLQKILDELAELKKSQNISGEKSNQPVIPTSAAPAIRRFSINARDILGNCTNVYFSDKENDGTFLLTADAQGILNGKKINETFYLLFKSEGIKDARSIYSVIPTLSQSEECDSPIKRFCDLGTLTATRIGNLVTLHSTNGTTTVDMLLDIGGKN